MSTFLGFESLTHIALGDFVRAADVAERGIMLDPDNLLSHLPRIVAHYVQGDLDEARSALIEMQQHVGKVDPKIAWPWPEPVPETLKVSIPVDSSGPSIITFADLVAAILNELDQMPAS